MRKRWPWLIALIALAVGARLFPGSSHEPQVADADPQASTTSIDRSTGSVERAFADRLSNIQVTGSGTVTKLLKDDNDGSRHQRFILAMASGQTLLVAHNIDLAPRLDSLNEGDRVRFFGEYEWNAKGGVLHWTHHDPSGRHIGGWLELDGRRYQ